MLPSVCSVAAVDSVGAERDPRWLVGFRPSEEALERCDVLIVDSSMPYIEYYPSPGQAVWVRIDDQPDRVGYATRWTCRSPVTPGPPWPALAGRRGATPPSRGQPATSPTAAAVDAPRANPRAIDAANRSPAPQQSPSTSNGVGTNSGGDPDTAPNTRPVRGWRRPRRPARLRTVEHPCDQRRVAIFDASVGSPSTTRKM